LDSALGPAALPPSLAASPSGAAPRTPSPADQVATPLLFPPAKPASVPASRKPKNERAQVRPPAPEEAQQPPPQPAQQPPAQSQPAAQPPAAPSSPRTADATLTNLANGNRMQIEELSDQYTKMVARANAVKSAMDSLGAAQAARGMAMRGDWIESYNMLVTYMQNAKQALKNEDPPGARNAMVKAEAQLGSLEKAMGR